MASLGPSLSLYVQVISTFVCVFHTLCLLYLSSSGGRGKFAGPMGIRTGGGQAYLGNRQDGKAGSAMEDGRWNGLLRPETADSSPAAHNVGGLVDVARQGGAERVVHP